MSDIYNVWNGSRFEFTLRKICQIIFDGASFVIPAEFESVADIPITEVMTHKARKTGGIRVIFDVFYNQKASEKDIIEQIKNGLIVITPRTVKKENGEIYPSIYMDEPYEAWVKLGKYIKNVIPMPTIGITGSAGKTTATMFAKCVFSERYNVFLSGENGQNLNNLTEIVNQWILRCNFAYDFHIQECGGGTPRLVEREAATIGADMYGITNIDVAQHLSTYKTQENLIADKTSFDRVRKNDEVIGAINVDDEILNSYHFEGKITTFGIKNQAADYVGKNIVQNNEFLEFDVAYNGQSTHIKINIIGSDNVYNALMVFAFAKYYGFTDEEIQRGFLKYQSIGIRQRLDKIAGRYLYVDCFNASIASIFSSINALENLSIDENNKRIAIIGERDSATDEIYEMNYEAGKKLGEFKNIDEFIILGEPKPVVSLSGKVMDNAIFEGAKLTIPEEKISFYRDKNLVAQKLKKETVAGDAILLKGKLGLNMFCIFDIAFGTSYTLYRPGVPQKIENTVLTCEYYPLLMGLNLKNTKKTSAASTSIGTEVNGYPVVRIGDGAFADRSLLIRIIFGSKIRTIGKKAFLNCISIEQIELPKGTVLIEEEAFQGCTSLAIASLVGVGHVGKGAFSGCTNLKKVVLTSKCATIEDDAFKGCEKAIVYAPKDSYAIEYARRMGMKFVEISEKYILSRLMLNGTRRTSGSYFLNNYYSEGRKESERIKKDGEVVEVSAVICGDIMTHGGQISSALDSARGDYNFDNYFANTYRYFQNADIAIGNLETTFGPGDYTGFPKFNSPDYLAESIAKSGINVVGCANNHIYDTKYAGIIRTKKICQNNGLLVTGIKKDVRDKAYCIIEKKGVKVGVINYTYRTVAIKGVPTLNLNPVDKESRTLFNSFSAETLEYDLSRIQEQIETVRADGAEVILVYYHWGCEYECASNVMQKYIAYKTAFMGADAIIGSHPHVLQERSEIEITKAGTLKKVPVFYSLGNYIWGGFPMIGRESVLNTVLAKLNIQYDTKQKRVIKVDADYVPLRIQIEYMSGQWKFDVLSLNDMTKEEIMEYDSRNTYSVEEIKSQIEETLTRGDTNEESEELRFENLITVRQGQKINLLEKYLSKDNIVTLKSEDAVKASVLPNGELIAYSPGFVGITGISVDRKKIYLMVRVLEETCNKKLPILVDKNNSVKDYWRPENLVSGQQYGVPNLCRITQKTAENWLKLKKDASDCGINLRCSVNGYLTNKEQLLRRIRYAEKKDMLQAMQRYRPIGCTEHHLGEAIDIMCISASAEDENKKLQWVIDNAYRYGFLAGSPKEGALGNRYIHARYIDEHEIVQTIYENKLSVADYLMSYDCE